MMLFKEFRSRADELAKVTGRAKETLVRNLLEDCGTTEDRVIAALMLTGRLAEIDEPYTTGIKETFIANDLALEGMNSHEAMHDFIVARAKPSGLRHRLSDIWHDLRIYVESDERTKDRKSEVITDCMTLLADDPADSVFLLKLLTGKLSNGVDDKTILYACFPKEDREKLSRLFGFNPNIASWVEARDVRSNLVYLMKGIPTPGVPMEPQLCARVKMLEEVLKLHGATLVQTKLDGIRVHIHLMRSRGGKQAWLFTREQKNITSDYQELLQEFRATRFNGQCILDGELVALAQDGSVAPFSRLQKRLGRKTGRSAYRVGIVLYDILTYDDAELLTTPYSARLKLLQGLQYGPNVKVIETKKVVEPEALHRLLLEAHEAGEEGLVCKNPLALPAPGMRNKDWIKAKADYMDSTEFGDSYDLVVVGYNHGKGRRHGTVGAIWVATADEHDTLTRFCKVGTGFKDDDLVWFQANLTAIPLPQANVFSNTDIRPDVWVKPEVVIEVKAAQVSQNEHGAYSLRFPRFIRVREDKTPKSATTMAEIIEGMR